MSASSSPGRFAGKVVIVTGAAHGIGRATAQRFYDEGAQVALSDINPDTLARFESELGDPDRVMSKVTDVGQESEVRELVDEVVERFGGLDVLVSNAGIVEFGLVTELASAAWHRSIAVDLDAVFFGAKYAIPHLIDRRGSIVNTASISGLAGNYGLAAYGAAKGGVVNLTRNMAIDHARDGVRINSVCPGAVNSNPGGIKDDPVMAAEYERLVPMARVAVPEEIASVIAFLASDDASYITGHNLIVDGGVSAHTGEPNFNRLLGSDFKARQQAQSAQ